MAKKDDSVAFYQKAGPKEQSKQPPSPKAETKPGGMSAADWAVLRGHLEGRLSMLRTWRDTWWIQNWSDLARFMLPRRSIWLTQSAGGFPSPNTMTRGLEINTSILDPTATFAARVCSGGLNSGLASPSRPWFKIAPAMRGVEIDNAGRRWLDLVEDIVYTALARSNFYDSFAQECEDIVVFGTAPCIIYEDERDIFRCYNPCAGEYFLAAGATGRVDTLNRAFVMTVAQMVDFFGLDACPQDIQKLWAEKGSALATERLVAHSIEPNFAIKGTNIGKIPGDFTWREVYWLWGSGSKQPLSMRGFVDQPFTASRWSTQSNDAYGRSVGMDVLPDVMQLQIETERKAEGIEKGIRPPLLAHMELKNTPSSELPGMKTYVSDMGPGKGIRSIYETKFDLDHVTQDIAAIQNRIKEGLFNTLFLMISQQTLDRATTVEINARVQERLSVLGPVIEKMLTEGLKPKLARVLGILKRRGLIPAPPRSLENVPLDLQFVSILALAQKSASITGVEALIKTTAELAQLKPDVIDNLDTDDIIQEYNELLGGKQKFMVDPAQRDAIRKQRQQQMERQQQMQEGEMAANSTNTMASAASTAAQIPVGAGKTAIEALLGTR